LKPMVLLNATGNPVTVSAVAVDDIYLYASDSEGCLTAWNKPGLDSPIVLPGQTSTQIESLIADGQHLYSGSISGDTVIRIYNQDLDLIHIIKGHVGTIFDMSTDNQHLLSGSADATVKIWEKSDWYQIGSIVAQTHFVLSVALDDDYIFAGGIDNCTNVFSRASLKRVASLHGHNANVLSLATDDRYTYSGSGELWWGGPGSPRPSVFESAIRVWDKRDWSCVEILSGHRDNINALAVDKHFVYSASDDSTVRVYSKEDWSEVASIDIGLGRVIDLTHDDKFVYFGCADGNIRYIAKELFS
jgi:WD40 repeat protein